jgi:phosphoribosylanthranilate isomerase
MRIKICGITRPEDARFAEQEGADAIGVVLFSDSKRNVSVERAQEIFSSVGPFTTTVAVTHTQSAEELDQILSTGAAAIQIFSPFAFKTRPKARIIRAVARGDPLPKDADAIIVDDSHGGGRHCDLGYAEEMVRHSPVPVILAGGLTPDNVGDAIRRVRPYAVDVATGTERSPGIKDQEKVHKFIAACRGA